MAETNDGVVDEFGPSNAPRPLRTEISLAAAIEMLFGADFMHDGILDFLQTEDEQTIDRELVRARLRFVRGLGVIVQEMRQQGLRDMADGLERLGLEAPEQTRSWVYAHRFALEALDQRQRSREPTPAQRDVTTPSDSPTAPENNALPTPAGENGQNQSPEPQPPTVENGQGQAADPQPSMGENGQHQAAEPQPSGESDPHQASKPPTAEPRPVVLTPRAQQLYEHLRKDPWTFHLLKQLVDAGLGSSHTVSNAIDELVKAKWIGDGRQQRMGVRFHPLDQTPPDR